MSVEPNNPQKRWAHIFKSYAGTKAEPILPMVAMVSLHLLGLDDLVWAEGHFPKWQGQEAGVAGRGTVGDTIGALREFYDQRDLSTAERVDKWGRSTEVTRATTQRAEQQLDALNTFMMRVLPDQHPLDFVMPWAARELGRYHKAVRRADEVFRDQRIEFLSRAFDELNEQLPAIAMWARDENIDLNRTSLDDALEAIEGREVDIEVPQGNVVYEFDDGWTIQRLGHVDAPAGQRRTQQDAVRTLLQAEGEAMQHCVGGDNYIKRASKSLVAIFSLRDPNGQPHVTMEWEPGGEGRSYTGRGVPDDVGITPLTFKDGRFVQILGKQNQTPVSKYLDRIRLFVRDRFDDDPFARLMLGEPVSFNGMEIEDEPFDEFSTEDLANATFSGATLTDCGFPALDGTQFPRARLMGCVFNRIDNCDFSDALLSDCLLNFHVANCDFTDATIVAEDEEEEDVEDEQREWTFTNTVLKTCTFSRTTFEGVAFYRTSFSRSVLHQAVFRRCFFQGGRFRGTKLGRRDATGGLLDGVTFPYSTGVDVALENLGLTHVADTAAVALIAMVSQRAHDLIAQGRLRDAVDEGTSKGRITNVQWPAGIAQELQQ